VGELAPTLGIHSVEGKTREWFVRWARAGRGCMISTASLSTKLILDA
jgi:hypothetical protein